MVTLDNILDLIKRRGITEQQFLKDVGLNKSALSDWKKGINTSYIKHIVQIADYFNVSTDYLLGRSNEPTNQAITNSGSGSTIVGLNNSLNNNSISIDAKQEQSLSDDIKEIARIYEMLDVKKRHRLLDVAFALEEEAEKERND